MFTTTVPANAPVFPGHGNTVQQPPLIQPGDLFTVKEYAYTTFEFGTNEDFSIRSGHSRWPRTPDDIERPVWAFPHAAVISRSPIPRATPRFALEFGSVLLVAGYGWYRLARDHNRNVKFERV